MQETKSKKLEEFNVYSDEVTDVLTTPPSILLFMGNSVVLFAILILIILAWFIKYPDVIKTEGLLTTTEAPVKLFSQSSGLLQSLSVQENTYVKKGSLLAVVSSQESYDDLLKLENIVQSWPDHHDNETLDIENLDIGDLMPSVTKLQTISSELQFITDRTSNDKELYENRKLIEQHRIAKKIKLQRRTFILEQVDIQKADYERDLKLLEDGVVSQRDLDNSQFELLNSESDLIAIDENIQNMDIDIQSINRQIAVLTSVNEKAKSELEYEIVELKNRILGEIKLWMDNHAIRSPINGICSYYSFLEENQYVNNEQELFFISPDSLEFEVRGILKFNKAGLVKKGNKVIVKLPQFPHREHGALVAAISKVSYVPNKEGYLFFADLANENITSYGETIQISPLMPVNVEVVLEESRLIERIFYEIKNIFAIE